MKYRSKPEIIEAVQWFKLGDHEDVDVFPDVYFTYCEKCGKPNSGHARLELLPVCVGDWIIQDATGTHVVSDKDFKEMYEPVTDDAPQFPLVNKGPVF